MDMLLLIGIFLGVVGVTWVLLQQMERGSVLRRRMKDRPTADGTLTGPAGEGLLKDSEVKNPILAWVQSRLPGAADKTPRGQARTLIEAGFTHPSAPSLYVLIRVVAAAGLPLLLVLSQKLTSAPITGAQLIIGALLLCGVGLTAPAIFVDLRATDRRERLENQFPDALDLMMVCVEAGLGVDAAFVRVSHEIANSHRDIACEFNRVSQELRAGRSRSDALRRMAERINVDSLRAFAALMIQTESLGASITQTLRSYSSELRERRFLRGEEKAMRIPVLLTMPLVACILPVIVTALLLPAGLDVAHNLLPALKGRH
jgi:tight adherence protein C